MGEAGAAYDVAVIGGGASGLTAALAAARAGARVVVLERDVTCGLSILATGNGRCNLSNEQLDPARYRYPAVVRAVMGEGPEQEVARFFASVGIWTAAESGGRLYPYSRRAASVRDALLGACARAGVTLRCGCTVETARRNAACAVWELAVREPERPVRVRRGRDEKAALRAARRELAEAPTRVTALRASAVVLAPGGRSEGVCRIFGLPHEEEHPVLCPIACEVTGLPAATAALDGVRVHAALTLLRDGCTTWCEAGEALFRSYGISGIVAFNLSRRVQPGDTVELDLVPDRGEDALAAAFEGRARLVGPPVAESTGSWFDGMFDRRVGQLVFEVAALAMSDGPAAMQAMAPAVLAHAAKHIPLEIVGTADERAAQVRQGGIPFAAVEVPSLRVRAEVLPEGELDPGQGQDLRPDYDSDVDRNVGSQPSALYACGEALDMDADCGGFNLAWAWLSGLRAGTAAANRALSSDGRGPADAVPRG